VNKEKKAPKISLDDQGEAVEEEEVANSKE
jgi:hypothetical protein